MRGPGAHIRARKGRDGRTRYMVTVESEIDPSTGKRRQVSVGTYRTKREAKSDATQIRQAAELEFVGR